MRWGGWWAGSCAGMAMSPSGGTDVEAQKFDKGEVRTPWTQELTWWSGLFGTASGRDLFHARSVADNTVTGVPRSGLPGNIRRRFDASGAGIGSGPDQARADPARRRSARPSSPDPLPASGQRG